MIDLEIFTEEDFSRLIRWINSSDLLIQWAGPQQFTYPLTENQLNTYLRDGQGDNPKSKIFKVVSETMAVVGHIELGSINRVNGTASICRVLLDHEWRGKGICVEMVDQYWDTVIMAILREEWS